MRKRQIRASGLFLMEILISILFFSLVSAVCVQFFVQSHLMSTAAVEIEETAEECSSMAELMESADSAEEFCDLLENLYGISLKSGESFVLGYNKNFAVAETDEADYIMVAELLQEKDMTELQMQFIRTKDEATVYSLSVRHHYPLEVSDAES